MAAKKAATAKDNVEVETPVTAVVARQFFEAKEPVAPAEVKNETIEVHRFVTEAAKVSVSMGLTLNLGNFESARIDVSVVVPCYREEVDAAYKYAHSWVEKRLGAEVQSIRENKPSLF